jgi:hypothetical protein
MKKKSKLWVVLAIVLTIGIKNAVKLSLSVGLTEAEIQASKYQSWDLDFKNSLVKAFDENCIDSALKDVENKINMEKPFRNFCHCSATKLLTQFEAAHIMPTKYNSMTTKEEDYTKQFDNSLAEFSQRPEIAKSMEPCKDVLKKEIEMAQK